MKKKYETCYFVTDVVSIPVVRVYGKTGMYRQAVKDGWGTVYRDENNDLVFNDPIDGGIGEIAPVRFPDVHFGQVPAESLCAEALKNILIKNQLNDFCGILVYD